MSLDLTNTCQALAEYDKTKPARDQMWERVSTNADMRDCELAEKAALNKVRLAFFADTKDRNSLDRCMTTTVEYMRYLCADAVYID